MRTTSISMAILGLVGLILSLPVNAQSKGNRTKTVRPSGESTIAAPIPARRSTPSMSLEPKLGFTYMGLTGKGASQKIEDTDQRFEIKNGAGYSAGVGVGIPMTSSFTLETGLHYFKTKAESNTLKASGSDNGITVNMEMQLDLELEHLAVPALGRYCFSGCAESGVFLRGGVIPTYLTGGRARVNYKVTASGGGFDYSDTGRSSDRVSDEDFTGLSALGLAGAGFRIVISPTTAFEFDANYARGLFKMNKEGGDKVYHHGLWTGAALSIAL